jgi:hypothetical protein
MPKIVFDDGVRDYVNLGGIFKELRDWSKSVCVSVVNKLLNYCLRAQSKNANPCLTCFLLRERKMSLVPPQQPSVDKATDGARGVLPFAIHTQAWSIPRVEGLRSNWNEPRDRRFAGRPTLWQGA